MGSGVMCTGMLKYTGGKAGERRVAGRMGVRMVAGAVGIAAAGVDLPPVPAASTTHPLLLLPTHRLLCSAHHWSSPTLLNPVPPTLTL